MANQGSDQNLTGKRKKQALGRGLDALIPDLPPPARGGEDFFFCETDLIRPSRYQPRGHFAEEELVELSESIRTKGVIQPLLVRRDGTGFELISGERRLRAAKMAGQQRVPVILRAISDAEMLEISLVENIQRENLNPIELAEAYHRLMSEFNLTQEEAAVRVGKNRSTVANFLRLRNLPEFIKTSIADGRISMGHARAILGIDGAARQNAVWRAILSRGLSVRETEALIRKMKTEPASPPKPKDPFKRYMEDVATDLSRRFGTKVQIKRQGSRGRVQIEFYSNEDLDRVLELLKRD